MNSKSMILALSASLSLGLANVAGANTNNSFQVEKLQTGYTSTDTSVKVAKGKCGTGQCGNNAETKDKKAIDKKAKGKCGAGKCGAQDKKGSGTCGAKS